ncbi:MAG: amino acid adenylation domain-containing protein [Prochloraceae cyanobacterium]
MQINNQKTQLSPAKQALLAKRLRGETIKKNTKTGTPSTEANQLPQIKPDLANRYQPFPLTEMQQAYWIGRNSFFELGNVGIHTYIELESTTLDLPRFNRAWQQLIERHDMLRAIVRPDGQQQILATVPPYEIEIIDLRDRTVSEKESQLQTIRDRLSHQVFQSDRWPLFELLACQLDNQLLRLFINIDGLFIDGWSYQILFGELMQLYQEPTTQLPTLELSFRDYVLSEIEVQKTELAQKSRQYWQDRLASIPNAPNLPLAKNPATLKHPHFVRREARLEAATWQKLKTKAARVGLTPPGVLLAAYAEVLALWSNSSHFTLNVPRFNRLPLHPQINQLIGEFASFTLLEIDNSQQTSFVERAKRHQEQLWKDLEHIYVSGVSVLRDIPRARGINSGVTMPVIFTSTPQNVDHNQNNRLPSWQKDWGEIIEVLTETPQVWLDSQFGEAEGSLVLHWDAVEELFPVGLLDDMFAAYSKLIKRLANEEAVWQSDRLDLIPQSQLEQRAKINQTETSLPQELVHTLFAQQAFSLPQQPAIISSDRKLTYQELYQLANQLGHRLRHLGAKPNQLVAVVMEKGWEQIVAVLGIVASGAAYVPIDPQLPPERLNYLLEDSQVQIILTQSKFKANLPDHLQLICLDRDTLASESSQPLEPNQQLDDLAYVIYTSGSTGMPKGVAISHRSILNMVCATNGSWQVSKSDRILALTALNHDLSVYDIFGLLAAGGTLVIPDAAKVREPAHWLELMVEHGVTLWNSVPPMMEMLLDYADSVPEKPNPNLRLAVLGGDFIPVSLPNRLRKLISQVSLLSIGGPTETTVWNIWYPVETVNADWQSIPYGRPIANAKYYVLNEKLEDCPIWVPGELYCSGTGLAKGYWNNPIKTAASFIEHPLTGERIYRTGDRGRYLPDGNIEFLGRADFQIKLRGYRIEPGEIEAALGKHPQIKAAVVTLIGEQNSDKRLIAYLTPTSDQEVPVEELRSYLSKKLPEYAIPSVFHWLESLPLSVNGKVDRKALLSLELLESSSDRPIIPPRNPIEEKIAAMWLKNLALEQVSVEADFFELGGNSLLATQLVVALSSAFQVNLSLQDLFEKPTIAQLAELIATTPSNDVTLVATRTIPITTLATEAELPDDLKSQKFAVNFDSEPKQIFITGGTGFLGAFLLHDLLQQTPADLHCLVRADNREHGAQRLQQNLQTYHLWDDRFQDRIIPIVGDLSQSQLGIEASKWRSLCEQIDVLYHNGALVNFTYQYSDLKAANVLGTQEILRLASQIKVKPVHFISSVAVFSSDAYAGNNLIREQDSIEHGEFIYGGYAQSKWVAEKVMMNAAVAGFPVRIYRPGMIAGDSQTGACKSEELIYRMLQGFAQLGLAPQWETTLELSPVDYISNAIVYLSRQPNLPQQIFHIVNPQPTPWHHAIDWINSFGYPVKMADHDCWREALLEVTLDSIDNALSPLLPVFPPKAQMKELGISISGSPRFDCHNTLEALAGSSIACPPVDERLIHHCLTYLVNNNLLASPTVKS